MKIKQTLLIFALLIGVGGIMLGQLVSAETSCGGAPTSIIGCDQQGGDNADPTQSGVWGILLLVINILTAGIGVAAVGGVVYGSILYTTAGGSMDQTKQAKTIIFNVIIGLVAYALMYSFLNFLIPGGLL